MFKFYVSYTMMNKASFKDQETFMNSFDSITVDDIHNRYILIRGKR